MPRIICRVFILLICLRIFIPQDLSASSLVSGILNKLEVASAKKKCIDLTLSSDQPAFVRLEIRNINGKIVHVENVFVSGAAHLQLQLKKLNTGNYILNARSGNDSMETSFHLK